MVWWDAAEVIFGDSDNSHNNDTIMNNNIDHKGEVVKGDNLWYEQWRWLKIVGRVENQDLLV